ncbi:hypothetical protein [Ureibacillus thermophilus]|uniref:Uncharacterized protein n=1 Tax=Ureibacillus thermophilus TaxID=367743 RepID=A0A4V1A2P7_9BACL|nr:hypothetical protein [Ureibacillus thermophilus]QBK24490.1 hypothetical protein DKZ56_00300 [Ureibacillus thermophilus]
MKCGIGEKVGSAFLNRKDIRDLRKRREIICGVSARIGVVFARNEEVNARNMEVNARIGVVSAR